MDNDLSRAICLGLVTLLVLLSLSSHSPIFPAVWQPSLKKSDGSVVAKNPSTTTDDNEWTILETSVLSMWLTAPVVPNDDGYYPKPRILSQLWKPRRTTTHTSSREDITLVTHISVNKLNVLLIQLKRWGGPASVAVYLTSPEDIHRLFTFWKRHEHQDTLSNSTWHVVLERGSSSANDRRPWYPHNILRNVALETVESDYFVALDVDFMPSPNSHDRLRRYLQEDLPFRRDLRYHKRMFVLPAFELTPRPGEEYATEDMLPMNKSQVIQMVQDDKLFPFRKSGHVGHAFTDFDKWLTSAKTNQSNQSFYYEITLRGSHRREVWEPYVLAYRPGIHRYWEDFRGYGYDKFSFFIESQFAGYNFAVLQDLFCIHLDHPEVPSNDQVKMKQRNSGYYDQFKSYLRERYGEQAWLSRPGEKWR